MKRDLSKVFLHTKKTSNKFINSVLVGERPKFIIKKQIVQVEKNILESVKLLLDDMIQI